MLLWRNPSSASRIIWTRRPHILPLNLLTNSVIVPLHQFLLLLSLRLCWYLFAYSQVVSVLLPSNMSLCLQQLSLPNVLDLSAPQLSFQPCHHYYSSLSHYAAHSVSQWGNWHNWTLWHWWTSEGNRGKMVTQHRKIIKMMVVIMIWDENPGKDATVVIVVRIVKTKSVQSWLSWWWWMKEQLVFGGYHFLCKLG